MTCLFFQIVTSKCWWCKKTCKSSRCVSRTQSNIYPIAFLRKQLTVPYVYSERNRTSKMEILEKNFFSRSIFTQKAPSQMFDSVLHTPLELLTIFAKSFILDFQLRSEYAYGIVNYFSKRLRSSHQRCSVRKDVLRNFAKFTGNTCVRVFFNKVVGLAQVFSCEFSEISKNTFSQNNSGRLLRKALSQMFVQVLDRPLTF